MPIWHIIAENNRMAKIDLEFPIDMFQGMVDGDSSFIPIVSEGGDEMLKTDDLPDELPILPLRNMVLFPGVVMPVSVGRSKSLTLVREVFKKDKLSLQITLTTIIIRITRYLNMHWAITSTIYHINKAKL